MQRLDDGIQHRKKFVCKDNDFVVEIKVNRKSILHFHTSNEILMRNNKS